MKRLFTRTTLLLFATFATAPLFAEKGAFDTREAFDAMLELDGE